MKEYEKRTAAAKAMEFRADESGEEKIIEGYFAVFGDEYDLGWGCVEKISPHAFDNVLANTPDVRACTNHDDAQVLGRTTAGTLELRVDEHGLFGKIKINPEDTDAVNTWARVKRGDVNQASFGFRIKDETREYISDERIVITITDLELYEVSVCTFPAYEGTSLSARGASDGRGFELWKEAQKERIKKWH